MGLDEGFDLPVPIETINVAKVDESYVRKWDLAGVSVQTLKIYIQQVAPQVQEEYSKHKFLDGQIEDFYIQCEDAIKDKQKTIKDMQNQVKKIERETMDEDEEAEVETKKKPKKELPKGHDLVPPQVKIKNL